MFYRISFFSFLVILFVLLGVWQLNRLNEKEQLINLVSSNLSREVNTAGLFVFHNHDLYKQIVVRGKFIKTPIFIYNTYNKEIGYEVIQPFLSVNKQVFLVNRGFVTDKDKISHPAESTRSIKGVLIKLPEKKPIGINNDFKSNVWFYINNQQINSYYGFKQFVPAIILLQTKENLLGEEIDLHAKTVFRNDHFNYALTWFSLAVITVIMSFMYYKKYKVKK